MKANTPAIASANTKANRQVNAPAKIPAKMPAKPKRGAPQSAPDDEDDDDEMPRDMEAFRRALARKISIGVSNVLKRWRSCAAPSCKRARGCCAPRGVCGNVTRSRPIKPEHEARNRAQLHRMIREQAERIDAERQQEAK